MEWRAVRAPATPLRSGVPQVDGHSGSFMLQTDGTYDGTEARTRWLVVPGSGTDELQGLRGEGTAVAPHGPNGSYTFDYDLG